MYPYRCLACQALTNLYEPEHPYLIPVAVVDDRDMNLLCERCGARAERMEDHHWYPRAIDEQEAEKWPRAILCQPCHTKWKNDVQTYYANGGH